MSYETEIIRFIEENLIDGGTAIDPDLDLLSGRVIDSLAILQILEFVDGRFGIALDAEDVTPESFSTVRSIARLLALKTGEAPNASVLMDAVGTDALRELDAPLRSLRG